MEYRGTLSVSASPNASGQQEVERISTWQYWSQHAGVASWTKPLASFMEEKFTHSHSWLILSLPKEQSIPRQVHASTSYIVYQTVLWGDCRTAGKQDSASPGLPHRNQWLHKLSLFRPSWCSVGAPTPLVQHQKKTPTVAFGSCCLFCLQQSYGHRPPQQRDCFVCTGYRAMPETWISNPMEPEGTRFLTGWFSGQELSESPKSQERIWTLSCVSLLSKTMHATSE